MRSNYIKLYRSNTCRVGFALMICFLLSSCSSLRKADDRHYSAHRKTRTHKSSQHKTRTSSKSKTASRSRSVTKSTSVTKTHTSSNTAPSRGHKSDLIRNQVIAIAKTYQGSPYQYGGESPSGFDCSGFIQYVYNQVGVDIPRTSNQQSRIGKPRSWNQSAVGDIIVFGERDRISHVGLVCAITPASLKVIHSTSSRGVIVTDVKQSEYWQRKLLYARDVLHH